MAKLFRDASKRAAAFQRIRDAHQTELAEDYVELIEDLIENHGEARMLDIAESFGINKSTATQAVQRLQKQGLVDAPPYKPVTLTEEGQALAEKARQRHEIIYDFFIAIGVSEQVAFSDSEGVEHHVSDETLRAFKKLTAKLKADS
ncbi:MAG: manganese-binding transcriptional regulator MntR [Pseudomonadota bacterium]